MGRPVQARAITGDPIRNPIDHGREINHRPAEQPHGSLRVCQQRRRPLLAGDARLLAKPLAELLGEPAYGDGFRSRHVERAGGRRGVTQAAQRVRAGIALPYDVDVSHADVDRFAVAHLRGNVEQHTVAHVDCIVEAEQPAGRGVGLRVIFENPLAPDAGVGVFAGRGERRLLGRTATLHRDKRIDATGREGDDARGAESLGDNRRHLDVHRPGQRGIFLRAEFPSGHKDDVPNLRQCCDCGAIQEIAGDGFDPAGIEAFAQTHFVEARDADHASAGHGIPSQPR